MSYPPLDARVVRFLTLSLVAICMTSQPGTLFPQDPAEGESDKQDTESTVRKAQRDQNLKAMGRLAAGIKVLPAGSDKSQPAELNAKPLFHYTDEPRRIVDATLWGWMSDGRLQAVCKIENYDFPQPGRKWLYCFGSLSTSLLDVEWKEGRRWSSRKPGIELQPIAESPAAADSKPARLRQMKEIANRFQATILVNDMTGDTQEMRLLPRPLFRYEQPTGELADGALFGLTTNGTNPDAILVIELRKRGGQPPRWMFGAAGMTAGGLTVKLDGDQVWDKPFVGNHGSYETWLWFHGKPEE